LGTPTLATILPLAVEVSPSVPNLKSRVANTAIEYLWKPVEMALCGHHVL